MPPSYYDDMVHHMIRSYGASCGQIFVVVCEHTWYRGLQVAWHKNRDEIGACAKFQFKIPSKFRACADLVAIFVPSNLQSSVAY